MLQVLLLFESDSYCTTVFAVTRTWKAGERITMTLLGRFFRLEILPIY